jgi:hypothetical protein
MINARSTIRFGTIGRDEVSESGQEFPDGEGACPVFGMPGFPNRERRTFDWPWWPADPVRNHCRLCHQGTSPCSCSPLFTALGVFLI